MAVFQAAYGGNDVNLDPTGNRVYYVDNGGSPTAGPYNVGDLALIMPVAGGVAPTSMSPLGYRCTTAGTPGTWTAIGTSFSSAGTVAVASTTTILATGSVFRVSGTNTVSTITATGLIDGSQITIIPTGNFPFATGGNIGLAGTAVTGKALTFSLSGGTWYPSYIA